MRQLLQNLLGNSLKYHRADVPPVVKVQSRLLAPGDRAFPSQAPPIQSCEITVESLVSGEGTASKRVTTLEGLVQENPRLADCLTQAFLAEQAAQCGYCTAGILMTAAALLRDHADKMIEQETTQSPSPVLTLSDVTRALDDHLCRCGSHRRVMRAVMLASELYSKQVHTQPLATSSGLRV